MLVNSARVIAITNIATAPINQLRMAAGPAICEAYIGPNSQAEPIMPLIAVNIKASGVMERVIFILIRPAKYAQCCESYCRWRRLPTYYWR